MLNVLHLSDLHIDTLTNANKYRLQLQIDLINNLQVKQLDYLVITGDISSRSANGEYDAAFELIDKIVKRFNLQLNRVIITPGNHDLNWDLSEDAYKFIFKRKINNNFKEGLYIPAGNAGLLLRDEDKYKKRFEYFSERFYKKIYSSSYPLDYAEQGIIHVFNEDQILFLSLNSNWEIDHYFQNRVTININSLVNALDKLDFEIYDDFIKIAICHHPVTGPQMMSNVEFLEILAVNGFQVLMHGHIHEASEEFYEYDPKRSINIIGAGTFGAPVKEQVSGIPLQYNLLTFDLDSNHIKVYTRKKEKPDGAWSADARWGDKNNPKAWYTIVIKHKEKKVQEVATPFIKKQIFKLRYLHLSDLHISYKQMFGNNWAVNAFNQDVVTRSMLEIIKEIIEQEGFFDFIIISGDLAQHGKDEEYQVVQVFMSELLKITNLTPQQLFFVPGNHDIDRNEIKRIHIKHWYNFETQDEITETLIDSDLLPILMRKFRNFNNFSQRILQYPLFDQSNYFFVKSLQVKKVNKDFLINILGLNSCLFAGYDGDDNKNLVLGLYQTNTALQQLHEEALISIGFFHHPFHCFNPIDKVSQNLLSSKLNLILTGHLHQPSNTFIMDSAGKSIIVGAGASFITREHQNTFNITDIDLTTGDGRIQFYKYLAQFNLWKKDTSVNPYHENGIFTFSTV